MATGNWGDPSWGNQFADGPNSNPGNDVTRNQNVYEFDPNKDTGTTWSNRVWQQSTADFGRNNLNPYLSQNPNANSPYARWYQSRYGTVAPMMLFNNNLLSGQPMTAQAVAAGLQGMQRSGDPAGARTGYTDLNVAKNNLNQIGGMVKNFSQGNTAGYNGAQQGELGQIMNDPSLSSQMIMAQLQGAMGGWGMNYIGNELQNLQNQYYNDPANMGPQAAGGPFFNRAMNLLGMGS